MKWNQRLRVGNKYIGVDEPVYTIAEVGSNHDQSIDMAFECIDAAADAGASAVKFQSLKFSELYTRESAPKGIEELFEKISLSEDWHAKLAKRCAEMDIDFFSAPTYPKAVKILAEMNVPLMKIASPQFGFFPEVTNAAIAYGKPIIFSAGISTIGEIYEVLMGCQHKDFRDIVLLHCVSQYPTPPEVANINVIETFQRQFGCLVGYSDHTLGIHFPIAAVAKGASVVEKHFTLDKKLPGPDHHFALEPTEFTQMVKSIHEVREGLGNGIKNDLTPWEAEHRNKITMRLCVIKSVVKGEKIHEENITLKRSAHGLTRNEMHLLKEKTAVAEVNLKSGEPIQFKNVSFV